MFTSSMFSGGGITTPMGNDGWLGAFSSMGRQTRAGVSISPTSAWGLTAVQRAVSILAESFAQLPLAVYKKDAADNREQLIDHPVSQLLNFNPNGWMTPFEFNEWKQVCLGLRGNAFFLIVRNPDRSILSLYPLHPDRVQVMVSPDDRMPYYRVLRSPLDNIDGMYNFEDVHHIRWVSDNGYAGVSPILLHAEAIGRVAAVEEHSSSIFGNGTKLTGMLQTEKNIPDKSTIRQMKQDWHDEYAGSSKAGSVAILHSGLKFEPLSMTNEDAQLIATLNLGVKDVARIYGIPPHMLGDDSKGSNVSVEQMGLEFVTYTLMPWIKRHEEAIERDFLSLKERKSGIYVKYDVSALMRGDMASRYIAYGTGRQWGFLSQNDVRKELDMSPVAGGDTFMVPMNMADGKTGLPIGTARDSKENNE